MNKAEKLHQKIMEMVKTYDPGALYKNASLVPQTSEYYKEIHRGYKDQPLYSIDGHSYECWFYWYIACATKILKTKVALEIGADMGVSAISFLTEMPQDGKLYSIDIRPGWQAIPDEEKRIIKIVGDSLSEETINKFDYSDATLWLIDGKHDQDHVTKEVDAYKKYWKEGTVVMFDNVVQIPDLYKSLPYDKTHDFNVHYLSDFALIVI